MSNTSLQWKGFVACYCSAYPWIHTAGLGKCACSIERVYKHAPLRIVKEQGEDLCNSCGLPAETKEVDFGIGAYEFWGARGVDTNWQEVTCCCESGLVPNELESRQKEWFK